MAFICAFICGVVSAISVAGINGIQPSLCCIPAAVREADTVSSFKRKLKTHFLRATAVPAGTAESAY